MEKKKKKKLTFWTNVEAKWQFLDRNEIEIEMFNVSEKGGVNYALFLPSVKKTMEEKKPFCKKNNWFFKIFKANTFQTIYKEDLNWH